MTHSATAKLPENIDDSSSLRKTAVRGWRAILLELVVIIVSTCLVLVIADIDNEGHSQAVLLWIPLATMAAGVIGLFFAGKHACGALRNLRYVAVYFCVVALMIGVDMLICLWLGGSLLIVVRNWILLIGSASCVNILSCHLFAKYFQIDKISKVDKVSPFMITAILLLQIVQMFISVLGMSFLAGLAQIIARRIVIIPIAAHVIAKLNYGPKARELEESNSTIEYIATHSVVNQEGEIKEPNFGEMTVVGALLLRLPIFGGRLLRFNKESLTTFVDGCIFVEQMLAFSSPTMIVTPPIALLHISYVWKITTGSHKQKKEDLLYKDRTKYKALLARFIRGKRREYVETVMKHNKA